MKRPKRLTLRHKKMLGRLGYNPDKFLFVKETADNIKFYEIITAKVLDIKI